MLKKNNSMARRQDDNKSKKTKKMKIKLKEMEMTKNGMINSPINEMAENHNMDQNSTDGLDQRSL